MFFELHEVDAAVTVKVDLGEEFKQAAHGASPASNGEGEGGGHLLVGKRKHRGKQAGCLLVGDGLSGSGLSDRSGHSFSFPNAGPSFPNAPPSFPPDHLHAEGCGPGARVHAAAAGHNMIPRHLIRQLFL